MRTLNRLLRRGRVASSAPPEDSPLPAPPGSSCGRCCCCCCCGPCQGTLSPAGSRTHRIAAQRSGSSHHQEAAAPRRGVIAEARRAAARGAAGSRTGRGRLRGAGQGRAGGRDACARPERDAPLVSARHALWRKAVQRAPGLSMRRWARSTAAPAAREMRLADGRAAACVGRGILGRGIPLQSSSVGATDSSGPCLAVRCDRRARATCVFFSGC
eukprot:scaffold2551_cov376-Prasinococcus_capsulatus_cf.AAC.3